MTTVSAPYSKKLSAQELVYYLRNPQAAKDLPGHMSSFFGDVKPAFQYEFAAMFGIPSAELVEVARAFSEYSGAS